VLHAPGCRITDAGTEGLAEAVALAAQADVVVAVVGDHLSLVGETLSTATLELQGAQVALLDALSASGRPLVLVLVNSKPLVLPPSALKARAILQAFNPGMCGGQAVAEAVFGQLNPSGRLPISMPVHVGQQPVFYSQVRGQHGSRYADLTQAPRWPFGHGLGYTRFEWRAARLEARALPMGEPVTVRVSVRNVGERPGVEVVQVYVSDLVTSVTWVQRALQGSARVDLAPGESREVAITLPPEAFGLVDARGRELIEPGDFEVQLGPSSRQEDLIRLPLTLYRPGVPA
jgi:beta-glucosidase